MATSFTLTLDTAVDVSFGDITGTHAGELFRLLYTSDELTAAVLVLNGGQQLAMDVAPGELSVLLPPDAADGNAAVRVTDDVGNQQTFPAVAFIHGTPLPEPIGERPQQIPVPTPRRAPPPRRAPAPERRSISSAVTYVATTDASLRARVSTQSQHWVTSESSVTASREVGNSFTVDSTGRALEIKRATVQATATSSAVVSRRDDPDLEALLLAP